MLDGEPGVVGGVDGEIEKVRREVCERLSLLGDLIGVSGDKNAVYGGLLRSFDSIAIVNVARLLGVQLNSLPIVHAHSDGIVVADFLHSGEIA